MLRTGAPSRPATSPTIRSRRAMVVVASTFADSTNQRLAAARPTAGRAPAARRSLAPCAASPSDLVDKLLAAARPASQKAAAAAAQEADGGAANERVLRVGFRYDAANLRWVRDKRQDGKTFDMSKAVIRPFSGAQYMSWPVCHGLLTEAGLRSVPVQEARRMQKQEGWTLVDIRLADAFSVERAEGSVSAPLFRYLDERPDGEPDNGVWDVAKKVAMAAFAMRATERVPRWAEDFPFSPPGGGRNKAGAAAAGPAGWFGGLFGGGDSGSNNSDSSSTKSNRVSKGVLLICSVGGSMKTEITFRRGKFSDPERQFGRESRSLKAAYELLSREDLGWTSKNVVHVEGGLAQWRFEGLPLEVGEGEDSEVVGSEADELAAEEAALDADEIRRRRRRRQRQRAGGMLGLPF